MKGLSFQKRQHLQWIQRLAKRPWRYGLTIAMVAKQRNARGLYPASKLYVHGALETGTNLSLIFLTEIGRTCSLSF
jgi:hypothetical protein